MTLYIKIIDTGFLLHIYMNILYSVLSLTGDPVKLSDLWKCVI